MVYLNANYIYIYMLYMSVPPKSVDGSSEINFTTTYFQLQKEQSTCNFMKAKPTGSVANSDYESPRYNHD